MEQLLAEEAPFNWASELDSALIKEGVLFLPIAHPKVKDIPIDGIDEDLVDLQKYQHSRLMPLSHIDKRYQNTYDDYSKLRKSLYDRLLMMLDVMPEDIGIAYFEGFRPLWKQKEYFDKKFKEFLLEIQDKEVAYHETSKLISPFIDNVPVHCTGAAIDMTLFKVVQGAPVLLDMGMFDVIFGENEQQETFSENTTKKQRENRALLFEAAIQSGLVNYGYEWWHYSYGDKAWAYVKGEKAALYPLVADTQEPILQISKADYVDTIFQQGFTD